MKNIVMKTIRFFCLLFLFGAISCSSDSAPVEPEPEEAQTYFPPMDSDIWETTTAEKLNWHQDQLQPLLDFLEEKHTKSFIILYDGKIVVESYMNGHSATLPW